MTSEPLSSETLESIKRDAAALWDAIHQALQSGVGVPKVEMNRLHWRAALQEMELLRDELAEHRRPKAPLPSNPKLPPEAPRMTPTEADRLIEWHQMAAQVSEQTDDFAGARWHREKLAAWRAWRGVARASDETCDVEWLRKQLRTARNIIVDAQNFIHPTIVWRDVEAMQRAIDKFLGAFKEGEVNMGNDTRVNAGTSPHCPHCGVQEEIDGAWHKPGCPTLRSEPFDKALNDQIEAVARVLQQEAAADPQFPVRGLANYAGMAERIIRAVNGPAQKAAARQLCTQCTGWLDEHRHWCPSLLKPQCPWCGGEHVGTDCKAEKASAETKV